jgi:hypothetical protein
VKPEKTKPIKKPAKSRRKNFLCNFRAPNKEQHNLWLKFKKETRKRGLTNCYVVLSLCNAWMTALEGSGEINKIGTATQIINIQMQNSFVYNTQKRRRIPPTFCTKQGNSRTITRRAWQAYILEEARELDRSFSFLDFPEIDHNYFRKHILELKNRNKILPLVPRSNPRFYILKEWLPRYPSKFRNNIVKPKFSLKPNQKKQHKQGQTFGRKVILHC